MKATKNSTKNKESGLRVYECMLDKGFTQKELADLTGYTPQQINYIIHGKRKLTVEAAINIARALKVRYQYLLGHDNYKDTDTMIATFSKMLTIEDAVEEILASFGYLIVPIYSSRVFCKNSNGDEYEIASVEKYIIAEYADELETDDYNVLEQDLWKNHKTCPSDVFVEMIDEIKDYILFKFNRQLKKCNNVNENELEFFNHSLKLELEHKNE